MKFTNESLDSKFNYDINEWNLIIQLNNIGVAFKSSQIPEFVPLYESGKFKKIPLAFLTLEWTYRILNTAGKEILKFTANDKYQFNPFDYSDQDVKEMIAASFDSVNTDFEGQQIEDLYPDSIPRPSKSEFDNWCQRISQFLKVQTG